MGKPVSHSDDPDCYHVDLLWEYNNVFDPPIIKGYNSAAGLLIIWGYVQPP